MSHSETKRPFLPGLLLVAAGVTVNHVSVGYGFAPDEHIQTVSDIRLIQVLQGVLILGGVLLLAGVGRRLISGALGWGVVVLLLAVNGVALYDWAGGVGYLDPPAKKAVSRQIARMERSETLTLNLNDGPFKLFNKSLENLRIPSGQGLGVMADQVQVVDLVPDQTPHPYMDLPTVDAHIFKWDVESTPRTVAKSDVDFLGEFLGKIDYLEGGSKFYFIGGDFVGDDYSQWEIKVGFTALGKEKDGNWVKSKGVAHVRWQLPPDKDPDGADFNDYDAWKISQIRLESFKTYETPAIFFSEELDQAVPDKAALAAARRNIAQEQIVEMTKYEAEHGEGSWKRPSDFWGHQASWQNPSVSVVDLNKDGFDDFYCMARFGKNLFFSNKGDGTFEETAGKLGLDIENHCDTAIFADYDNDGDDDVFIGRTIAPSTYREQVNGHFEVADDRFDHDLPYFGVTASAVDYDQDGLLDLFIGTYAAQLMNKDAERKRAATGKIANKALLDKYLPLDQAKALFELHKYHRGENFRDRIGPPDLLYHNAGDGHFELSSDPLDNIPVRGQPEKSLEVWRNTYQATFSDYDGDGDQDVYLANDFAPNHMFRNDGGKFVDVTTETNARDIGFGMGVSWGDYDKDGDFDAYISNMYSKAGTRILEDVPEVDGDFKKMAAGNSLLELRDGRFDRVSTTDESKPGGKMLELGGWSWGSQWVDVDNDTWLDAYALSGYYTAPKEIAAGHDL